MSGELIDRYHKISRASVKHIGLRNLTASDSLSIPKSVRDLQDKYESLGDRILEAANDANPTQVQILLNNGANPDTTDFMGRSPLHLATSIDCSCAECIENVESCVQILLAAKANVNIQDNNGNTPLHIAIHLQLINCAKMMISHGADVTLKSRKGQDPVKLMCYKLPEALVYLLDQSVEVEENDPHNEKCLLKVNFRPIIGDDSDLRKYNRSQSLEKGIAESIPNNIHQKSEDSKHNREMQLLRFIYESCKYSGENILTHPVVGIFLHLKWSRVRIFFFASFLAYLIWVAAYTSFVLRVYMFGCPWTHFNQSGILSPNHLALNPGLSEYNETELRRTCESATGSNAINTEFIFILVTTLVSLFVEIGKMFIAPKIYLRSLLNLGVWILIVLVFSTTIPTLVTKGSISSEQYQLAALTVFLAWAYFLTQFGRLPKSAKFVEIFGHVLKCFATFAITFSTILLAFVFAFCILFPEPKSPYKSVGYSILKVIVMMTGEVDYQGFFYSGLRGTHSEVFLPEVGHFLYALFVILICLILMNLFIGLTVSDIQTLEKQAELARVRRLIVEILHLESTIFSERIPRIFSHFFKQYISVCQQEGRDGMDGFSYSFRPNCHDEKSVPDELKRATLSLAHTSYRRTKSKRCAKVHRDRIITSGEELIGTCSSSLGTTSTRSLESPKNEQSVDSTQTVI